MGEFETPTMNAERQTLDIESDYDTTGEAVVLDTRRDDVLDVLVAADAAADFELDRSNAEGDYLGPSDEFAATDSIAETLDVGSRFVRLKVATGGGTATAGDTADVLLSSKGHR